MNLTRLILSVVTTLKYKQFVKACKHPENAQDSCWQRTYKLLSHNHMVKPNLCDNPITDVEDYLKFFDKNKNSNFNPLTGDEVLFWAQSAGTTGNQKVFPLSKKYQKQFQNSIPPFLNGLIKKYDRFLKDPSLYLAALDPIEESKSGVPIGYISNYNYHHMPSFIKKIYVLPNYVLKNSDIFAEKSPLYSLANNLNSIFAVTPLSIQKFMANILDHWDQHLKNLESFMIGSKKDSKRLEYLKSLDPASLTLKMIWPTLQFICCWKSSICSQQLQNMGKLTKGVDIVDAIYSATEGWINVPSTDLEYGGPIHPNTHNLEFLLVGEKAIPSNLIQMWELEIDKEYEVFITNNMGLVRYRLYDIIKCTGYFYSSPIVHFVRKAASMLSLGIVTISENELVSLANKLSLPLDESHYFCPNEEHDGFLYCYSHDEPSVEVLRELDKELKLINTNYQTYTESMSIREIKSHRVGQMDMNFHAQTKPKYLYQTFERKNND